MLKECLETIVPYNKETTAGVVREEKHIKEGKYNTKEVELVGSGD